MLLATFPESDRYLVVFWAQGMFLVIRSHQGYISWQNAWNMLTLILCFFTCFITIFLSIPILQDFHPHLSPEYMMILMTSYGVNHPRWMVGRLEDKPAFLLGGGKGLFSGPFCSEVSGRVPNMFKLSFTLCQAELLWNWWIPFLKGDRPLQWHVCY